MENQEVYQIAEGVKKVTIVHKKALNEQPPVRISYKGNISAIWDFLGGKHEIFDQNQITLLVNREDMEMDLLFNETDPLNSGEIIAKLSLSKHVNGWGINKGHEWSNDDLAEYCKMNRSHFSNPSDAMKLFSELKNLRLKVDKQFESENDNRGTTRVMVAQKVIQSSIPEKFKLKIPIFKGEGHQEVTVELYVNPSSYNITLISPELNDYIEDVRDDIFERELKKIGDTYEFSIIEV